MRIRTFSNLCARHTNYFQRHLVKRYFCKLGLGEDDYDPGAGIQIHVDRREVSFVDEEDEEFNEIDDFGAEKVTVQEIIKTVGLDPYDMNNKLYQEQNRRHNLMTFDDLKEWNQKHSNADKTVDWSDEESDDELKSSSEEELSDSELIEEAQLDHPEFSEEENDDDDETDEGQNSDQKLAKIDLQSEELSNLRRFWTNASRHERFFDSEVKMENYRDLDLHIAKLKKPETFFPKIGDVPDPRDFQDQVLTVDEMEAMGISFEEYENRVGEKSPVEMNETWENLNTINERKNDLKLFYLQDRPEYGLGYFDDPPKDYPVPYSYPDTWRVSFPINEIIQFLQHERARTVRVYDVKEDPWLQATLKDYLIFCEGVHLTHARAIMLKLEKYARNLGSFRDPYFTKLTSEIRSEMDDTWGILDLGDTTVVIFTPEGRNDPDLQEMEDSYADYLYGTYGPKTDMPDNGELSRFELVPETKEGHIKVRTTKRNYFTLRTSNSTTKVQ